MRQFYLVQDQESYYCLSCCTGCWDDIWIQGGISFHKGWYLSFWKAASWSSLFVDRSFLLNYTWWPGDGQSLGTLLCASLFLAPVDVAGLECPTAAPWAPLGASAADSHRGTAQWPPCKGVTATGAVLSIPVLINVQLLMGSTSAASAWGQKSWFGISQQFCAGDSLF